MNPFKNLLNITRDRKIHVLMLEAGEDCSELVADLSPTLQMLAQAAKYQGVKDVYFDAVHAGCLALHDLSADFDDLWQLNKRDPILQSLDAAIELNKRLQMKNINRAMVYLAK